MTILHGQEYPPNYFDNPVNDTDSATEKADDESHDTDDSKEVNSTHSVS